MAERTRMKPRAKGGTEPVRGCWSKVRYGTPDEAQATARDMRAEKRVPVGIYKCRSCGGYHVTTRTQ